MTYDPQKSAREKSPTFGAFQLNPSHLRTLGGRKVTAEERRKAVVDREQAKVAERWAAAGLAPLTCPTEQETP